MDLLITLIWYQSSELEMFVPSHESGYNDFHQSLSQNSTFYYLKKKLTPKEYYIIFYRTYPEKPYALETISNILGVSRQAINQVEFKVKNKARKYLKNPVPDDFNITEKDILPIPFEKTLIMIYLKDYLTPYEYFIFYKIWYKENGIESIIDDRDKIKSIYQNILDRYSPIFNTKDGMETVRHKVLSIYNCNQIFEMNISPESNSLKLIESEASSITYPEILKILGEDYFQMSAKQQSLIDNYFNPDIVHRYPSQLERALRPANLALLGYKNKSKRRTTIPLNELWKTYQNNKDEFSEEVQSMLESTYFYSITQQKKKFNKETIKYLSYNINRLELIHFNINNFFEMRIPNEELLEVLNNPLYKFSENQKDCVILKFISGMSVGDIAIKYNMPKDKMRDFIWDTYDFILNVILNKSRNLNNFQKERFYEYIMNPKYEFTNETREACRLFFFENQNYEYIKNKLNISSTTKVSNMITEAIHKMEFWYYGISYDKNLPAYPLEKILEVLSQNEYTDDEKKYITDRFIELVPLLTISERYNIDFNTLLELMEAFNIDYIEHYKTYKVTEDDILEEYFINEVESILTKDHRKLISLMYGIKSEYNPEGIRYSYSRLISKFDYKDRNVKNLMNSIKKRVYNHKFGFIKATFETFKKEELEQILKDPHLPLSDVEIELIKEIKGIDTEPRNYKEINKKYDGIPSSAMRRIYRAYVTIKKYLAGEIEGKIVYELDVKPYLRYFPKYEQTILYQRYALNWIDRDFARHYKVNDTIANKIFFKVEKKLLFLRKYPHAKKFDFDYAREVIYKDDLPFYGNKEFTIDIYIRYFGDAGNAPESINEMQQEIPNISHSSILLYIKKLMIAVLKYKQGIRKPKTIPLEEVKDYYLRHQDDLSILIKRDIERILQKYEEGIYQEITISDKVLYAILKEKESMHYTNETPIAEIKNLLLLNPYNLSSHKRNIIRQSFGIPRRDLMSGKEKSKLFKLLEPYILKHKHDLKLIEDQATKDAKQLHESKIEILNDHECDVKKISGLFLSKSKDKVLIIDEYLEYLYAYIINQTKNIDMLTRNDLIRLLYYLQKHIILNTEFEAGKQMLLGNLTPSQLSTFNNLDPYIKAYFIELLKLKNTNMQFNPDLPVNEYIKRHFAVSTLSNYRLKCRIPSTTVNFIPEIQDKYQEINLGRILEREKDKCNNDTITYYMDHLNESGILLANSTSENAEEVERLFKEIKHETIPFRTMFRNGSRDILIKAKK